MDDHSILSAFVVSARQFESSDAELNLLNVQRHLDVILDRISSLPVDSDVLDPRHLVVTETYSCLVNIILNKVEKPAVVLKAVKIFQILGTSPALRQVFQSKYQLPLAVILFLQDYGLSTEDFTVLKCLKLLEIITQDLTLFQLESHIQNFVNFLISEIDNVSEGVFDSVLHILSNLCRHNKIVRLYISDLPNAKKVFKSLIAKLRCPVYTSIIYAMSILSLITFNNYKYEKIFTRSHLIDTFELVVHLLITKDDIAAETALDLLLDFSDMPSIFQQFVKYDKLEDTLTKVANSCCVDTPDSQVARCLKFLWAFTKADDSKPKVCAILCSLKETSDSSQGDEIKSDGSESSSECSKGFHKILTRANFEHAFKHSEDSLLYSLKLINSMLEVYDSVDCQSIESSLKDFVKEIFCNMNDFNYSYPMKKQFELFTAAFALFYQMIQKMQLEDFIFNNMDENICEKIILCQLENNFLSSNKEKWSEPGTDMLLAVFVVVICLSEWHPSAKEIHDKYIQDPRLILFLTSAFDSTNHESVNRCLYIISKSSGCSVVEQLGKCIALENTRNKESPSKCVHSPFPVAIKISEPSKHHLRHDSTERNVNMIIQQVKSGTEVQNLHTSEILEVYDYKIATLTKKEEELQSLVLAKSAALQQADKVLSQYKCQHAQREAETLKLCQLLKQSEKRSEISKDMENQALAKNQAMLEELMLNTLEIKQLTAQHQERGNAINELRERLAHQVLEHENEKKSFQRQLKEKSIKIEEMENNYGRCEDALIKREKEYEYLAKEHRGLQLQCEQKEKDLIKMENEKRLIELVCHQRETALEEKDDLIKCLKDELEKLKHITGIIHEMSGKINPRDSQHRA